MNKLEAFQDGLADLADRCRSFRNETKILVERCSGFLELVLAPLLEGLAELVYIPHSNHGQQRKMISETLAR